MDENGFEALEVWQKAHELSLFIHKEIVPKFPPEEKWDLTHQIRRSSKSIAANIAEGHGRFYHGDNVRFCYNARGSLAETIGHLRVARDLDYIGLDPYDRARRLADATYRLLNGYIAYLKRSKMGADEPGVDIHPSEVIPPPEYPAEDGSDASGPGLVD